VHDCAMKPWKSARTLTAVAVTAALGLTALPVGGISPATAAPAPSITTTSKALVNSLPFVDPIFVGYKDPPRSSPPLWQIRRTSLAAICVSA
jgi:hypothetical protein